MSFFKFSFEDVIQHHIRHQFYDEMSANGKLKYFFKNTNANSVPLGEIPKNENTRAVCMDSDSEVTEKEKGIYLVSYCPKVRGRHKLNLLVKQQPIAGSPFDVFVEHPPTQLGKPVRIIKGVEYPCALSPQESVTDGTFKEYGWS